MFGARTTARMTVMDMRRENHPLPAFFLVEKGFRDGDQIEEIPVLDALPADGPLRFCASLSYANGKGPAFKRRIVEGSSRQGMCAADGQA